MNANRRDVTIAIGIRNAKKLAYLSGAVNGARAFHQWATALGHESRLVTDENEPVTIGRLRSEIEDVLKSGPPIHRLILYFAGHGLIREAEEGLWLLSDWDDALRAVAIEPLKRRLYMHEIQQIAIISDSCRSLPPNITALELCADPVLGSGPIRVDHRPPAIDKFIATQDGSATFMVPGVNPEDDRCLFSGVLMEGLWGLRAAAFSRILQDKVTSRSLGAYLAARVPEVAALYRCKVIPTFNTNFPEGDDIYFGDFGDRKRPIPPSFPAWPGPDVFAGLGRRGLSRLESHAEDEEVSDRRDADARSAALLKNRIRSQARPNRQETGAGFAIEGGRVEGLWTPHDVMPEHHRESNWWRVRNEGNPMLLHSAPVLIEFEDGVFAATTALPNFIASVLRGQRGISAIVYRQGYDAPDTSSTAEDALAKMEGGTLRAATDVMDVAVDLRQLKHVDPVLGVISAYLYDSIGDLDNIRRMAYYYARNGQPIPYDIALLAQLRRSGRDNSLSARVPAVEAREPRTKEERSHGWTYSHTPETEGQIGGLWPWMRQGWAFLDDHVRTAGSSLVHPRLIALRNNLEVGRFTTFDSDGAQKLAKAFNLLKHTG